MKISLFIKLIAITIVSVVVTSTTLFFLTNHYVVQVMDDQSRDRLNEVKAEVEIQMDVWKKTLSSAGFLMAGNVELQQALLKKDTSFLQNYCGQVFHKIGVDALVISDTNGIVVAGEHVAKGDSVRKQVSVQKALQGISSVGIEQDPSGKLVLQGGYPVFCQGQVVGVISLGMHLGNAFVDNLKDRFHVMATIFEGETRIATTLIRNNKRAVGTKISNPKVIERVLKNSRIFFQRNRILGEMYDTIYWPVINAQGNVTGMFFVGHDRKLVESTQKNIMWSVFLGSLVVATLMIILGVFFARAICRALGKATFFAAQVARGHLDEHLEIASKDEIGELSQSLNVMANNIRDKIQEAEEKTREAEEESARAQEATKRAEEAQRAAEQARREGMLQAGTQLEGVVAIISSASEELSAQIELSGRGAEDQSARVSETATAMEQMNGAVLEVARNSGQASELSSQAREKAQTGAKAVQEASQSMVELQDQAETLKTDMAELDECAGSISQIMGVISDIADQTNLLALNAAIEAARAGDAGRGFAVVADEVRKLAEKTMASTADVSKAISQIQESATKSTQQVEKTGSIIEELSVKAQGASDALTEIVALVDESADQVRAIATASEQQSSTSEEINRSVTEINSISDETARAMQEATQAVSELARQSQELSGLVQQLKDA